jgi:hypothetical protein
MEKLIKFNIDELGFHRYMIMKDFRCRSKYMIITIKSLKVTKNEFNEGFIRKWVYNDRIYFSSFIEIHICSFGEEEL